jgi:phosphatidylglycerophosphatase A
MLPQQRRAARHVQEASSLTGPSLPPVALAMPNLKRNPLVFRRWRHCVAFGFGSGLAGRAPGTVGTLVAVPLYLVLAGLPWWLYAIVVVVAFAWGVRLCGDVARDLGVHDHGGIVFDEFVGYWTTMFLLPTTWSWMLGGFAMFRLLDIWKPWPIRWCDRHVGGGLGVMLDDFVAGALACLVLHATRAALGG